MYTPASRALCPDALEQAVRSADLGDAVCCLRLAEHYAARHEWQDSKHWAERAGNGGCAAAHAHLGWLSDRGLTGGANYAAAAVGYKRAADAGDPDGMIGIAELLTTGRGLSPDPGKAAEWLCKAADGGCTRAMVHLADLWITGRTGEAKVDEALTLYRQAAGLGDEDALTALGRIHAIGAFVERDDIAAFDFYSEAANKASALAMADLGTLRDRFESLANDELAALEWLSKSIELIEHAVVAGEPWALRRLAELHETGAGIPRNPAEAENLYARAMAFGDAEAAYRLGNTWNKQRKYDRARDAYELGARLGHCCAIDMLGQLYNRGHGVVTDKAKAVELFKQSIDRGCEHGNNSLADAFRLGDGVAKNAGRAMALYRTSAARNNSYGVFFVAYCLDNSGSGPEAAEAARWYARAVDLGNVEARSNLGRMHRYGLGGLRVDHRKALELFRCAAENGSSYSMHQMGKLFEEGTGVAVDLAAACSWYEKAAKAGSVDAMAAIANALRWGYGCNRDHPAAFDWFHKAATLGNVWAMRVVGEMLRDGQGTEKSLPSARTWLQRAIDSGDAKALATLGYVELMERNGGAAYALFKQGEAKGDASAHYYLGLCYGLGAGVAVDHTAAADYMLSAAAKDVSTARAALLNTADFREIIVAAKKCLAAAGCLRRGLFRLAFTDAVDDDYRAALKKYFALHSGT